MTDYGYIRTSRAQRQDVAGMDPAAQEHALRGVGVDVANIFRDMGVSGTTATSSRKGWHALAERLREGDVVVVCELARVGRNWVETVNTVRGLRQQGIRLRSIDPGETEWAKYLEADPDTLEHLIGQVMLMFGAWCTQKEWEANRNRTIRGMAKAASEGRYPGRPRAATDMVRQMVVKLRLDGLSHYKIAEALGHPRSTIRLWLKEAGVP